MLWDAVPPSKAIQFQAAGHRIPLVSSSSLTPYELPNKQIDDAVLSW